jgi:predicted nucleic acid-binding protein
VEGRGRGLLLGPACARRLDDRIWGTRATGELPASIPPWIDWSVAHPGVKAVVERCYAETGSSTRAMSSSARRSAGSEVEREAIRRLVSGLRVPCIDPDGARLAGELRETAGRRSGRTLGDALIAALAIRTGATIVTRNAADFAAFDLAVLTY